MALGAGVRPERRFPCLEERLLRYRTARNDERVHALGEGFGDDVRRDTHLLGSRKRLDCETLRVFLEGVDGHLRGVGIRRIEEVVLRRVVQLVEIAIVKGGFLYLETVFAQERFYEHVAVDPLVAIEFLHVLLEPDTAGIEEGEADAVAREFPVALGGYRLFKK